MATTTTTAAAKASTKMTMTTTTATKKKILKQKTTILVYRSGQFNLRGRSLMTSHLLTIFFDSFLNVNFLSP